MHKYLLMAGALALAGLGTTVHADNNLTTLSANAAATKKSAAKEGWQGSFHLATLPPPAIPIPAASMSRRSRHTAATHGPDNTFAQSVTALTTNLAGSLALSVSYTVNHNSTVLPTFKNTDTITSISLVHTF